MPSFVQRLSARMMGTALVIAFSIQHPGVAMADNKDLLVPTTIEMDFEQSWGFEFEDSDALAVSDSAESDAHTTPSGESTEEKPLVHTVERRDSLRMLAERYLGDPKQMDLKCFVLNQGQPQEVGGSLTDPARLQPGWELVMPAEARLPASNELTLETTPENSQQTGSPLADLDDSLITVKSGDTLWRLAAHHLNDPERWVDIFNSNQHIIQDPNVIVPGWQLQLPVHDPDIEIPLFAEPHSEPLPELTNHAAPVMAFTTARPTVVATVTSTGTEGHSAPSRQTMFAFGGLGVFASSLGWVLARLRRTQHRRLPNGRMPPLPSSEAVHLEQQLQTASDPDSALFLDASLRVLSSRVAGSPPPNIIGASLDSDSVSILLSSPAEAPPGFHASEDSMIWRLSREAGLEHLLSEADGVPAPLPALATVGMRKRHRILVEP